MFRILKQQRQRYNEALQLEYLKEQMQEDISKINLNTIKLRGTIRQLFPTIPKEIFKRNKSRISELKDGDVVNIPDSNFGNVMVMKDSVDHTFMKMKYHGILTYRRKKKHHPGLSVNRWRTDIKNA